MSELKVITTEKLKQLVADTEATLSELKTELEHRQEETQSQEIDRLEEHMKSAELSLQTIRDVIGYIKDAFQADRRA